MLQSFVDGLWNNARKFGNGRDKSKSYTSEQQQEEEEQ